MELRLNREKAYDLVVEKIGVNNLLKHILAVEAGMRRLAEHLDEDVEYWGLIGLVHDLDYNETRKDHAKHTYITEKMLAEYELPDEMLYAIHAHPGTRKRSCRFSRLNSCCGASRKNGLRPGQRERISPPAPILTWNWTGF